MTNETLEIQRDFLEGTYEVFSTMFTDMISIRFLDELATEVNVYQEAPLKVYQDPISVYAKIVIDRGEGETEVEKNTCKATITIPTQVFKLKGIDYSPSQYEKFKSAIFVYKGVYYQIEEIIPTTNVADEFLFHKFICTEIKRDTLDRVDTDILEETLYKDL